jgi:alanine dehydrogenase
MLILSEPDLRQLLPMEELIAAMADALAAFSSGGVQQPLRTVLEVGTSKAFFGVMPAFIPASGALGTKLVTVFGSNLALGLPSHLATIILLDSTTGEMRGLLDGRYITEARTAAVSAVSTQLLARPAASTLAIIGTGVQAWSHLEALRLVRKLSEIRVWSPTAAHRARFASEAKEKLSVHVTTTASAREAVEGADLIALVSSSREPVVHSAWVQEGAHVCAVGACRPDQREMDSDLVGRARLFVDSRTAALAEAGDIVLPIKEGRFTAGHIAGELGEVVSGRTPGRTNSSEVTIFKSLGMAVEDVAAAQLAFEKAGSRGLGRGILI